MFVDTLKDATVETSECESYDLMPRQCQTSLTCLNTVPHLQVEAEASQLRARVQFLTQENEDLAQRNEEVLTRSGDVLIISSHLICVSYILCSGLTE